MFAAAEASCTSCPFLQKKLHNAFPHVVNLLLFIIHCKIDCLFLSRWQWHLLLFRYLSFCSRSAVSLHCVDIRGGEVEEAAAASWRKGGRGGKEWRSEETLDTTSDGLERQRKEGDLWWEKK